MFFSTHVRLLGVKRSQINGRMNAFKLCSQVEGHVDYGNCIKYNVLLHIIKKMAIALIV